MAEKSSLKRTGPHLPYVGGGGCPSEGGLVLCKGVWSWSFGAPESRADEGVTNPCWPGVSPPPAGLNATKGGGRLRGVPFEFRSGRSAGRWAPLGVSLLSKRFSSSQRVRVASASALVTLVRPLSPHEVGGERSTERSSHPSLLGEKGRRSEVLPPMLFRSLFLSVLKRSRSPK